MRRRLDTRTTSITLLIAIMLVTTVAAAAQEKIAFVRLLPGEGYEIFTMNPDGTGQSQLTSGPGSRVRPSFSPDGNKIVFDYQVGIASNEIGVINGDGTGEANLSGNEAHDQEASFSPDGTRIVFMSSRDGRLEVYVMNSDGTAQTRLTDNECQESRPTFSPDGGKILFEGRCNFVRDIYVMNADGSNMTNLPPNSDTDCCSSDYRPAFSPDGSRIVFASDRDGTYELYVMNADGANVTRLPSTGTDDEASFSPDGTKIVFSSRRDGGSGDIYTMNADGSGGVTRLTLFGGYSPSWYGPVSPPTDTTDPTVSITTPANGVTYTKGQSVQASYSCQDEAGGSGIATCTATVANGSPIDTGTVGSHTFTVTASDNAGNTVTATHTYNVVYDFAGFFQPVENLPGLNLVSAGGAVALKFTLGGNQGGSVLAPGYPVSSQIACDSTEPGVVIEETVASGNSTLSYNPTTGQYSYIWKTERSWRGTCRMLIVRLNDNTDHLAKFRFR